MPCERNNTKKATAYTLGYATKGVRYCFHASLFLTWSEVDLRLKYLGMCVRDASDLWCYVRTVSSRDEIIRHPIEPAGVSSEDLADLLLQSSENKIPLLDGMVAALREEQAADEQNGRDGLAAKIACLLWSIHCLKEEILTEQRGPGGVGC